MTPHRVRRLALGLIGLLLLPPLLWVGVVLVAPTAWATRQLTGALEARTGRSVRLEGLAVQLLGGVRVTNLEIGSPQNADDPWLRPGPSASISACHSSYSDDLSRPRSTPTA